MEVEPSIVIKIYKKNVVIVILYFNKRHFGALLIRPYIKKSIFFLTQGCVDREMWNRMGEQGFLGTSIAAEKGGIGGTFKDEAIVLEEQIYANCHAPAIGVSKAGLFEEENIFLK